MRARQSCRDVQQCSEHARRAVTPLASWISSAPCSYGLPACVVLRCSHGRSGLLAVITSPPSAPWAVAGSGSGRCSCKRRCACLLGGLGVPFRGALTGPWHNCRSLWVGDLRHLICTPRSWARINLLYDMMQLWQMPIKPAV